ncbi:hypothetical protein RB195_015775 [Necator americanus]|uniref:IBR domain-containing protein n=1 Tax=Necator americanus TaxID=51031 RepID=A0ABR1E643_NECAM
MSLCEDEAYHHDYEKLVTKGSYQRSRRTLHQQKRRSADNAILTKTLLDPAGVLSKKQKNRLLSARDNDFQFDVPYSLNKHCRWETVNPKSLLLDSTEYDHDVLVAEGVANTCSSDPELTYRVQKVHLFGDDALTTLFTSGKPKELAFFNEALRERKDTPKDELDTARIQFNIIKKNSSSLHSCSKSLRRKKRKTFPVRKFVNDTEVYEGGSDESFSDSDSAMEDEAGQYRSPGTLALIDFISESSSSTSNHVSSTSKESAEPFRPSKVRSKCLTPLADISQVTHMHCIFEVFDIPRRKLKPFDLQEKVSSLVPMLHYGFCVVRWFDSTRVSVSNQPLADTVFFIFFELRDNLQTLRCRINTNTQYSGIADKKALTYLITRAKDFDALLHGLLDFISKSKRQSSDFGNDNRIKNSPENFIQRVNSRMMATRAQRYEEHDQYVFVKEHGYYEATDSYFNNDTSREKSESCLCRICRSSLKTDLFPSVDGVMCKDCITSEVLHQLRLKQFPIRIPLVTVPECSPMDLLYAILPVPVMSTLIKMSFSHFYTIQNPAAMFTCCPQCSMSLVVNIPNKYDCCVCPYCKCYWCYRCCWEPHWPMSCQEFKEWSRNWDEQYPIERLHLDESEKVIRITCGCSQTFYASEDNAHGTYCPNKKCPNKFRFDKAGLLRTRYDLWCWHTARERQLLAGEDGKVPKRGTPTEPQVLLPKRIIKKEIAAICADARDVRFHQEKRVKFKDVILKTTHCKSEQNKFIDIRTTILLLVEHCTAWLYIHRKLSAARDLKTLPSKLFQQLMSVERKIEDGKLDILTDMNLLESETLKLISAFVKLLQLKVEATKAALAASGYETI